MKRLAVLLLAIPLAGEAKLIREPNCPPPLEPFNQTACLACNETPWKETTPILFGELRGKKTLLGTSEVKFNYGLDGRDPDNRPISEEFPLTLPVSLYEIGGGHYGCFRFPKTKRIFEERTYCIPLAIENQERLTEFRKGAVNVYAFYRDSDSFWDKMYDDIDNWRDNRLCLDKNRYEVTSPEIKEALTFAVNTDISVTTLKNVGLLDFALKMSRQRVADGKGNYSDYLCLMVTPDYSVVKDKDSITGDIHACFKVAGPKPY